jgi:hypothetical protein
MAGHCNKELLEAAMVLGDIYIESAAGAATSDSTQIPSEPPPVRPCQRVHKKRNAKRKPLSIDQEGLLVILA